MPPFTGYVDTQADRGLNLSPDPLLNLTAEEMEAKERAREEAEMEEMLVIHHSNPEH